jgi:RND family efflux transporter MFP subunit
VGQAVLREAKARLSRSERDLDRTQIVAPYDGRVRSERVDVGQFVKRGESIGTIYAVDFAEVRLPIPNADLAYLDLALGSVGPETSAQPSVTLSANFAGTEHQWLGQVVRTEGELDPTTRMIHVVARIPEPYGTAKGRAPLAVGMFVDAEIHGQTLDAVSVLPRSALRSDKRVLVVDTNGQLRFREVEVLRLADDKVYIGNGLVEGERVCISALQSTSDGMQVRVAEAAGS